MRIRFTRLSNDRHLFEVFRNDGSSEDGELETRSFMLHDLIHFALESEAGLEGGFFGLLARGETHETSTETFSERPDA